MKKLKTLEEHEVEMRERYKPKPNFNGIACPNCGEELVDADNSILTSMPPRRRIKCVNPVCTGFDGTRTA